MLALFCLHLLWVVIALNARGESLVLLNDISVAYVEQHNSINISRGFNVMNSENNASRQGEQPDNELDIRGLFVHFGQAKLDYRVRSAFLQWLHSVHLIWCSLNECNRNDRETND